jgi:aspartyl-tRNA(Asn)/glutamyl-tRNA(Gln) amidotransferase subunit C
MPPRITREEAARIAALAKLEMTTEELDRAARELESMLDHFGVIGGVDTRGIAASAVPAPLEPRASLDELRHDTPLPSLPLEEVLRNAPDADPDAGLFRVPRVLGS